MERKKQRCRSCGAEVFWTKYAKTGNDAILDYEPVGDGNIYLGDNGEANVMTRKEHLSCPPCLVAYKSHFSTCPHSKKWRKS